MVREVFAGKTPPSPADLAAGVIAGQADAVASAAEGCDVLVAGGLTTAAAGAQAVSEQRGIRYLHAAYAPCYLPSPYYPPLSLHGQPAPPDVTDNRALWDLNAQGMNAVFGAPVNAYRASLGLPAVDNVRDYVSTDHPWLAADPVLAPWQETADFTVVHHGGAGTTTTTARGRRAPGGRAAGGGPALLGRPGGRPGHRRGPRRSDSDVGVSVGRAQDGPDSSDPR